MQGQLDVLRNQLWTGQLEDWSLKEGEGGAGGDQEGPKPKVPKPKYPRSTKGFEQTRTGIEVYEVMQTALGLGKEGERQWQGN